MSQSSFAAVAGSGIQYATPSRRVGSPVFAGAAILLGGLGLVALGGCFLIGVMMITSRQLAAVGSAVPMSVSETILLYVLYVAAFACFGGALAMLLIGTRALLRILNA